MADWMVSHPEAFAFFPSPLSKLPSSRKQNHLEISRFRELIRKRRRTWSSLENLGEITRLASSGDNSSSSAGGGRTAADGGGWTESQRSMPTPFLTKTYQLVDDPAIDNVISWNEDGTTFIVWRPIDFARDLLPKYFKHNNFSNFLRQLSTYGFRKIMSNRWEFTNECFRRGEKRLLCDIRRRKITPGPPVQAAISVAVLANRGGSLADLGDEQILSSNSSPGGGGQRLPVAIGRAAPSGCSGSAELIEENERLRRENMQLSHELGLMKNLYSNILLLMSKYASNQQQGGATTDAPCGGDDGLSLVVVATPPELMPARWSQEEEEAKGARMKVEEGRGPSPRLFGVPIGLKRSWHDDAEEPQATVVPGCEI